jgi:hypothetical protein
MSALRVEVRDDEIIVTQAGSKFRAVYTSPTTNLNSSRKARHTATTISWPKRGSPPTTRRASWGGLCNGPGCADMGHPPGLGMLKQNLGRRLLSGNCTRR